MTRFIVHGSQHWDGLNVEGNLGLNRASMTPAGRGNPNGTAAEGVGGLRYLGVRELTYKLAFLASSVMVRLSTPAGTQNHSSHVCL